MYSVYECGVARKIGKGCHGLAFFVDTLQNTHGTVKLLWFRNIFNPVELVHPFTIHNFHRLHFLDGLIDLLFCNLQYLLHIYAVNPGMHDVCTPESNHIGACMRMG